MQCEKKFMHKLSIVWFLIRDKSRVVFVHAMKAERGSRSIASPILNISTRWRWMVDWTPQVQLLYPWERTVIPFKWGAGWVPELVWILWRKERSLAPWLWVRQQPYATNVIRHLVFKISVTVKLHKMLRSKHSLGMQDSLLATVVHSINHGMDAVEHWVVFWGPFVWIVPFVMRLHMCFSMPLVLQPQWCLLHWLMFIQSVGNMYSQLPWMLHFMSLGDVAIIEHVNVWVMLTRIMQSEFLCLCFLSTVTGTEGEEHVAVSVVCVFLDELVTTEPCCALCVLCIPNSMFTVMVNSTAEKCVTPFDGDT